MSAAADTIRQALPPISNDIPPAWQNTELRAAHAALDALVAAVAAAEQERDEAVEKLGWFERTRWVVRLKEERDRADAAVARADRLETALRETLAHMEAAHYPRDSADPPLLDPFETMDAARAALASPAPDRDGLIVEPMDLGVEIDTEKVEAEIKMRAQVRGSYFPDVAAPDRAEAECPSCGPDGTNNISFDRTLCACGSMHDYCNECGWQTDECAPAALSPPGTGGQT